MIKVQGITARKSNLAITSCILIKAVADSIIIRVTDLETGFEGVFPANVDIEGEAAINSKKLLEIIREFPDENISFHETENRWIKIGCLKIEYNIMGMNPADFPPLPDKGDADFMEFDAASIKNIIEKCTVIPSGGQDDRRAYVHGILFENTVKDGCPVVRMVSTDAKRLFIADYQPDTELMPWENVIIPKKGLSEVARFIDSESAPKIKVGIHSNHFIVKKPYETIIVSLLDGEFPEYQDITVSEPEYSIEIVIQPLLMALKRMSILTTETYRSVIFDIKDNSLRISATNPELGESEETIPFSFEREPIEVAFNPRFFMDALTCIDDDNAIVNLQSSETPCIIEGKDTKNFKAIIMPVKI